CGRGELFDYW
nr:immunoglobulin heavy chain junction region [Mus musculus]NSM04892.1 immunoglobulin heavy chain junction region [Mus musculus]NSM05257.1 immunoglobulin heavy chain junction region [Mus musculus]NSM05492.1 immunoglobulin heavy chain junction region [Mus musculus]NSM07854.1 immunoglobulin heavy chain junction region [Mus musculus]